MADETMAEVDFDRRATEKHHLTRDQILTALVQAVYDEPLPDDPTRYLVLGDDSTGRPLEVIVAAQSNGRGLVIHAMPLLYRGPQHPFRVLYDQLKGPRP